MIRKPFRTPLLRRTKESVDNDGDSEPQAKKRRMSSDKEDGVETTGAQLVFKTSGISSLPRKPLLAVTNHAVFTKPLDRGLEGYYNVLWYVYPYDERTDH